jgi:hypothetical protein
MFLKKCSFHDGYVSLDRLEVKRSVAAFVQEGCGQED